jgi:CheY-like chemotaxis protein
MVGSGAIRALLVEDNPGDASLTRWHLAESLGSAVDTSCAARVSSALQCLERDAFDVVILDLMLPDASGLEAVTQIVRGAAATPVVILTGLDDDVTAAAAFSEGVQDFLVKGVALSADLGRAVRKAICRKRAEIALMHAMDGRNLLAADDIISSERPAHVLVVDSLGVEMVSHALKSYKSFFVLHEARTYSEALAALSRKRYDAIVLDPELPDIWPNEAYKTLLESSARSPLIALVTPSTYPMSSTSESPQAFALVRKEGDTRDLVRRLLVSATVRNRAEDLSNGAGVGDGQPQLPANRWQH